MAVKTTVDLEALVNRVNERNAKSTCDAGLREGWNSLVESLLMDANAYDGFWYLESQHVPTGYAPGIIRADDPKDNVYPDETRRHYSTQRLRAAHEARTRRKHRRERQLTGIGQ